MANIQKTKTIIVEENPQIRSKLTALFYRDKQYDVVSILPTELRLESTLKRTNAELLLLNGNTSTCDLDLIKKECIKKFPELKIDSLYKVLEKKYCRQIVDFPEFYKTIISEQVILDSKKNADFENVEREMATNKKMIYRQRYLSRISDLLVLTGFPAGLIGYKFIREAILLTVEKPNLLVGMTKYIYPEVAKKFNTTAFCVERSIRHAIEITWARSRVHKINELYNIELFDEKRKPSNGEFMTVIADKVRAEIDFGC